VSDSPPLLTTPLHALHKSLGARLVPFAGYALPIHYNEGIMAEHLWVRAHAGLFDVSHMGQILVAGPQADAALESLLPADIKGLGQNRMRYSLLLNDNGGILDDLMITRRADDLLLIVNGACKHEDLALLQAKLPAHLTITPQFERALLALQGPEAALALRSLNPAVLELKFMQAGSFELLGKPAWISRSGYTGEDGFEIALDADDAMAIAQALLDDAHVKPIGLGARDSLRLEAGLPLYGHDLDPTINPVEAALSFAVSKRRKTEGGFPGALPIMAALLEGASAQVRVGLLLDGRLPAREGAAIFAGGECVGRVTSGGFSPSLQQPIAMGYVNPDYSADQTALEIEVRSKLLAARVVPMPFVAHRYHRG
jgi:aminomethyltransferase